MHRTQDAKQARAEEEQHLNGHADKAKSFARRKRRLLEFPYNLVFLKKHRKIIAGGLNPCCRFHTMARGFIDKSDARLLVLHIVSDGHLHKTIIFL